jgi:hypothetical protein
MTNHTRQAAPNRQAPRPAWGCLYIMEGDGARVAGQFLSDNPYDSDSEEGRYWAEGWHESDAASDAPPTPTKQSMRVV